ncbi:MAG: chromosome segregation protein SMC [SAR324 cluster bacterium]|nr:chromosome segregation protein SMC [SAR324 cluster bacterium]MBL7034226.1 chromosome segregation protein SMC [SAR324 cluster bacterium]
MRIKNIKVSGFKSFCHPVNLQFKQNGITIVVGPNGCGKSNVVDAIRWVLGEQRAKHLRGGSMEDVIFSGSSIHKPSGMAEVSLTFSNPQGDTLQQYADYTEISVTRRLYRSGDSVYMINKTPVRLKDVRELFMDTGVGGTGYSIIEQGRVGEIVNAKPIERRTLIDDAAGIVKFRFKRETAEKRLEETTQNLLRVTDVLGALAEQEDGLREHVERAEKYLQLQEQTGQLERQHLCLSWHQAGLSEQKAQETVQSHQQQQQDLQNEKSVVETEMERLNLEQTQRGIKVGERREELFQKEQTIQDSENQRELEKQNLQNVREQQQNQETELESLKQRKTERESERTEIESRLKEMAVRLGEMQAKLVIIEDERTREIETLQKTTEEASVLQKRLLTVHTELTNQTNQKNFLEERLDNLSERQQRLQDQEQSHRNLLQESTLQVSDSEDHLENLHLEKENLSVLLTGLEVRLEEKNTQLIEKEKNLEDLRYQQSTAQSRLESLQQIQTHYEGFSDSVKMFMQLMHDNPEKKKKFGVAGLLADFIAVSTDLLDTVSPVMAEVLDWVVLEHADTLPQLELFCRENELGQLHFVALDRPATFSKASVNKGNNLDDILQIEGPLQEWGRKFFSRFTLLKNETDFWIEATKSWPDAPFERISSNGIRLSNFAISIGKVQSGSLGFLQRQQQIRDVENYAEGLQKQISILDSEVITVRKDYDSIKEEQETSDEKFRNIEYALLSLKKELEHHQLEERRMQQTVSQLSLDSANILEEMDTSKLKEKTASEKITSLEKERSELENNTKTVQESIQEQQSRTELIAEELLSSRVSLTEATEQQKNMEATADRLRNEFEETTSRLEQLENSYRDGDLKLEISRNRITEIDESFEGMLEDRSDMKRELDEEIQLHEQKNEEQTELTKKLQERQGLLENSVGVAHQESLRLAEFRIQREQLETQLQELTAEEPEEILAEIDVNTLDQKIMGQELRVLKARLNAMGAVNLAAPEEYAVLTERIDFLKSQSDDLQKAVEDLKESIKDINVESRRRFKNMFDQINENLQSVFSSLFEGGVAKLVLTEAEDLLSAGVDIVAQPPGKKLQNLNLLSGGEKALTAISLIFAIFLVKPSPFCLLDEVDAPLDDVNVVRFNRLITSLSYDSQFILITHNKKTMEIGDLLYGITMEEPGISKTVSVEFKEAERLII